MPPWRHTHSKRQLGSYQVKGSWWWNRGILTEVVMRCRIRAALSSTLASLAQEHALHFQSTTPTIWKRLTLWKTTLTLFGSLIKHSLWVYVVRCAFDAANAFVKRIFEHLESWEGWKMIHNTCPKQKQKLCLWGHKALSCNDGDSSAVFQWHFEVPLPCFNISILQYL